MLLLLTLSIVVTASLQYLMYTQCVLTNITVVLPSSNGLTEWLLPSSAGGYNRDSHHLMLLHTYTR